jgi:hypothetical protein
MNNAALYLLALPGLWLVSGTASALDCWVPTVDNTQPRYRKDPLPNIRAAVALAEQIARDNPYFKAMLRPIRIRTQISLGPSHGQINVKAYRPDVWEGACGVVPGADRCCSDGGINMMINSPESVLPVEYIKEGEFKVYLEPRRTGTVAGFPELDNHVVMTLDGRLPWSPVSVGEILDYEERHELADQKRLKVGERPAVYGLDPRVVEKAYENMKKFDAKSAEQYRKTMEAQMPKQAEEHRKRIETTERLAAERLAKIRQARAALTPAQLAAPAYAGDGSPYGLSRPEDPRSQRLVRLDPDFPDRKDPDRVQMISVFISIIPQDPVVERRETMRRTKETFDYTKLAQSLR